MRASIACRAMRWRLETATPFSVSFGMGPTAARSWVAHAGAVSAYSCINRNSNVSPITGIVSRTADAMIHRRSKEPCPRLLRAIVPIAGIVWAAGCGGRTLQDSQQGDASEDGAVVGSSRDCGSSPYDACGMSACALETDCPGRPCIPSDATRTNEDGGFEGCANFWGWKWDGVGCVAVVGCGCVGADCGNLLTTRPACLAAYSHCSSDD
jgi:hypothetical protein